jgi:hypothetical protein
MAANALLLGPASVVQGPSPTLAGLEMLMMQTQYLVVYKACARIEKGQYFSGLDGSADFFCNHSISLLTCPLAVSRMKLQR